jgi:hypothetical protein
VPRPSEGRIIRFHQRHLFFWVRTPLDFIQTRLDSQFVLSMDSYFVLGQTDATASTETEDNDEIPELVPLEDDLRCRCKCCARPRAKL